MNVSIDQLAPASMLLAVLVLGWDILLAGWMAARREAPSIFTQLTSACGLLVAPALVVAIAAGTEAGARTVSGISWLLPAVCGAFVLQVLYALLAGLISPVIAIPILLYDLVVTAVASGDYLVAARGGAPLGLQAAVAARDVVMGMTIGRASLVSPLTVLVPMIAPAYPARWRLSAVARAVLVLAATAATTILVIEWPRGVASVSSYRRALNASMQARPAGDFQIGMRFLPVLDGPPPARAVRADRALAEQFAPDVVFLVLAPEGTRAAALDSLARILAPLRTDSVTIAVALHHGRYPATPDSEERRRVVDRVLRRLRPDVLFPAIGVPVPSVLTGETPDVTWWKRAIASAVAVRDTVRPATRIGVALSRLDMRDSATYAWASTSAAAVDIIGAVIYPSFSGLPGVDARLRAFDRWHGDLPTAGGRTPTHWLANVGGLPHAHGDSAQLAAMRHTLAWGSRHGWITAAILGEPADYDAALGVRAANGRVRVAWPVVSEAAASMRDMRTR